MANGRDAACVSGSSTLVECCDRLSHIRTGRIHETCVQQLKFSELVGACVSKCDSECVSENA
eukprot:5274164-Pleurochrysis_carterae.AAC.1